MTCQITQCNQEGRYSKVRLEGLYTSRLSVFICVQHRSALLRYRQRLEIEDEE